jgi:hypothetical protein
MNSSGTTCRNTWAIVLAAGEGSRLHSLTTTESGIAIPKQWGVNEMCVRKHCSGSARRGNSVRHPGRGAGSSAHAVGGELCGRIIWRRSNRHASVGPHPPSERQRHIRRAQYVQLYRYVGTPIVWRLQSTHGPSWILRSPERSMAGRSFSRRATASRPMLE